MFCNVSSVYPGRFLCNNSYTYGLQGSCVKIYFSITCNVEKYFLGAKYWDSSYELAIMQWGSTLCHGALLGCYTGLSRKRSSKRRVLKPHVSCDSYHHNQCTGAPNNQLHIGRISGRYSDYDKDILLNHCTANSVNQIHCSCKAHTQ